MHEAKTGRSATGKTVMDGGGMRASCQFAANTFAAN